jgi:hypothetical protein
MENIPTRRCIVMQNYCSIKSPMFSELKAPKIKCCEAYKTCGELCAIYFLCIKKGA